MRKRDRRGGGGGGGGGGGERELIREHAIKPVTDPMLSKYCIINIPRRQT